MTPPTGYRPAYPLLTPLLESWRLIVLVGLVAAIGTFALRMVLVDRRYEARATLMTVSSARAAGAAGNLAALSMLAGQGGANTPPELVARVLATRHVLTQVGLSPVDSSAPERVIDRLSGTDGGEVPASEVARAVDRVLDVTIDRKTGLLDVVAQSPDSALARLLVTRVIATGGREFTAVMQAQASAQRSGQEARVTLRAEQLRSAETRGLEFARANRSVTPLSASAVRQRELEREVELARQAYSEAVAARESAYARELEQTPAVVVVDPLPSSLPTAPRYILFYAMAFGILAAFVYVTLLLLRDGLHSMRDDGDPRARRFLDALERTPLIGRLSARR